MKFLLVPFFIFFGGTAVLCQTNVGANRTVVPPSPPPPLPQSSESDKTVQWRSTGLFRIVCAFCSETNTISPVSITTSNRMGLGGYAVETSAKFQCPKCKAIFDKALPSKWVPVVDVPAVEIVEPVIVPRTNH